MRAATGSDEIANATAKNDTKTVRVPSEPMKLSGKASATAAPSASGSARLPIVVVTAARPCRRTSDRSTSAPVMASRKTMPTQARPRRRPAWRLLGGNNQSKPTWPRSTQQRRTDRHAGEEFADHSRLTESAECVATHPRSEQDDEHLAPEHEQGMFIERRERHRCGEIHSAEYTAVPSATAPPDHDSDPGFAELSACTARSGAADADSSGPRRGRSAAPLPSTLDFPSANTLVEDMHAHALLGRQGR